MGGEKDMGDKLKDLTGMQFERLLVLHRAPNRGKRVYWVCECQCDAKTIKEVSGIELKTGRTKSCGCLRREVNIQKIKAYNEAAGYESREDGELGTRLYEIWVGMKKRCYNTNAERYEDYGGRGITVCDEWLHSFSNFKQWALSNGYSSNLTIERLDNDGIYSPDNCKWATYKEQSLNKRNTVRVEYNGETLTLNDIVERYNIPYETVRARYYRGWSIEKIIEKGASNAHIVLLEYNGETLTMHEISERYGIPYAVVKDRHRRGWSTERIINTKVNGAS